MQSGKMLLPLAAVSLFLPGENPAVPQLVPTPGCGCPQLGSCRSPCSPKCSLIISPNNCVIASTEVFQMPKLILLFMPSFVSNGILITSHVQKYWINSA